MPLAGGMVRSQTSSAGTTTNVFPCISLYGGYMPPKINRLVLQLYLNIISHDPSVSELTYGTSLRDQWFFAAGNPALKSYLRYSGRLTAGYYHPQGKWSVTLKDAPIYRHKPYVPMLTESDGMYMMYPVNIRESFSNTFEATFSYQICPWLEVNPYFEVYTFKYSMPGGNRISTDYIRYGGAVTISSGQFSASLTANSRTKEFEGDIITGGSAQYGATFIYKYKNCSFGASYNYLSHNDWTRGVSDVMNYVDRHDWKPLNYLVRLSFTCYFNKGKSRRHASRMVDADVDATGLNRTTKVKGPGE